MPHSCRKGRLTREAKWAYIFLIPSMCFFLVFAFIPIVGSFLLSFCRWTVIQPPYWVGLRNYRDMLQDEVFVRSMWNTLMYTLGSVPASVILGLCVATILNQQIRLRSFFRTVTYLPWVMSMVVASTLWRWLYSPEYGLLNYFLNQIGLPGSYWHTDPATAMLSVIIVGVWKSVGWNVVVFLAGLQGIPTSLYEAAQIDGANSRQQFAYITLPLLRSTTTFIVVMSWIQSFQVFDAIYVLTAGGPLNATTVMAMQIYENGFQYLHMGYASAQAYILFLMVMIGIYLYLRRMKTEVVY